MRRWEMADCLRRLANEMQTAGMSEDDVNERLGELAAKGVQDPPEPSEPEAPSEPEESE